MKRYLVLAQGHSADPHHGKTARGVIRYRRDEVVCLLDTQRAGETQDGLPVGRGESRRVSRRRDLGERGQPPVRAAPLRVRPDAVLA